MATISATETSCNVRSTNSWSRFTAETAPPRTWRSAPRRMSRTVIGPAGEIPVLTASEWRFRTARHLDYRRDHSGRRPTQRSSRLSHRQWSCRSPSTVTDIRTHNCAGLLFNSRQSVCHVLAHPASISSGGVLQARCELCGNDYDKAFQIVFTKGPNHTFDSFEC